MRLAGSGRVANAPGDSGASGGRTSGRHAAPTLVAARPSIVPSARAIVGALLCTLAAALTLTAYTTANRAPTTRFVVAAHDLEPGAALTANDLELVTMRLPSTVRAGAVEHPTDLIGANVLGPVAKGELLQVGNLIKKAGGPNAREVSFPIEVALSAGGRIRSADRVSVIATYGSGESATAKVIVTDAVVAHVDRPDGLAAGTRSTEIVTLSAEDGLDVLALAQAVATGKLMLVRTTGASTPAPTTVTTAAPAPEGSTP